MFMSATTTQLLPVGTEVVVNAGHPLATTGVVVEAVELPDHGRYAAAWEPRPTFGSYLVRLADGSVEGFTGAYLSEVAS